MYVHALSAFMHYMQLGNMHNMHSAYFVNLMLTKKDTYTSYGVCVMSRPSNAGVIGCTHDISM